MIVFILTQSSLWGVLFLSLGASLRARQPRVAGSRLQHNDGRHTVEQGAECADLFSLQFVAPSTSSETSCVVSNKRAKTVSTLDFCDA
jgi:hypothetical protein